MQDANPFAPALGTDRVWWSVPSLETAEQLPVQVTEGQLNDWFFSTVGWKVVDISGGAMQVCAVHASQVKAMVQAAMEEGAQQLTPKLRFQQVDLDYTLSKCIVFGLLAYSHLTTLELRELNILDDAIGQLATGLYQSEHLTKLTLREVWASDSGWDCLGNAIKVNTSLQTFRVHQSLTPTALGPLSTALRENNSITRLDISHNDLGSADWPRFAEALSRNPQGLKSLSIASAALTPAAASALGAMLQKNKGLTSLDLSHNALGSEGAANVFRSLASHPCLVTLDLSSTHADDGSLQALCSTLSSNTVLAVLKLRRNRFTNAGAAALAMAVKRASGVRELALGGNCLMGSGGARCFADILSVGQTRHLRSLDLSDCEVADGAAFSLGAALKTNQTLEVLSLSHNQLSAQGIAMFVEVLKTNSTLQLLDLSFNWVGPRGVECLKELENRPRKTCLVKCELHTEFRHIEKVKFGAWPDNTNTVGTSSGGSSAGAIPPELRDATNAMLYAMEGSDTGSPMVRAPLTPGLLSKPSPDTAGTAGHVLGASYQAQLHNAGGSNGFHRADGRSPGKLLLLSPTQRSMQQRQQSVQDGGSNASSHHSGIAMTGRSDLEPHAGQDLADKEVTSLRDGGSTPASTSDGCWTADEVDLITDQQLRMCDELLWQVHHDAGQTYSTSNSRQRHGSPGLENLSSGAQQTVTGNRQNGSANSDAPGGDHAAPPAPSSSLVAPTTSGTAQPSGGWDDSNPFLSSGAAQAAASIGQRISPASNANPFLKSEAWFKASGAASKPAASSIVSDDNPFLKSMSGGSLTIRDNPFLLSPTAASDCRDLPNPFQDAGVISVTQPLQTLSLDGGTNPFAVVAPADNPFL